MLEIILVIVLAWKPTWYPTNAGPETAEERSERRTMVAEVITEVSQAGVTELWVSANAAFLLTIMKFESGGLDYYVHGGEPSLIAHQDHMKARCLGQIHRNNLRHYEWVRLAGRDRAATVRCATQVLKIIRYHTKRCKLRKNVSEVRRWNAPMTEDEAALLLTAYGTGTTCYAPKKMSSRVRKWKKIHKALHQ